MDARELLVSRLPGLAKLAKSPNGPRTGREHARRPSKPTRSRMISVIIPAHNEEAYLGRTLESLNRQNYRNYEIIVVANGCTDRTAEIARGKCHRLLVLSQKSLGVSRNLGARMAKGELLVFLDADTMLEPLALRIIAENFTTADSAGTLRGEPDSDRFAYRMFYGLKNLIHRCYVHRGSSGVILCWKEDFFRVGGFDEGLEMRENSELIRRLGKLGRYRYVNDVTATTSMRRFQHRGLWRITWLWFKVWVQSLFSDLHHRKYETVR